MSRAAIPPRSRPRRAGRRPGRHRPRRRPPNAPVSPTITCQASPSKQRSTIDGDRAADRLREQSRPQRANGVGERAENALEPVAPCGPRRARVRLRPRSRTGGRRRGRGRGARSASPARRDRLLRRASRQFHRPGEVVGRADCDNAERNARRAPPRRLRSRRIRRHRRRRCGSGLRRRRRRLGRDRSG